MTTVATEDYLKHIFLEMQSRLEAGERGPVSMGRLAEAMAVVPGTATAMAKKLDEARLVKYRPYTGVALTAKGRRLALRVLRHHRLIETFLVETLGVDWSEVHDEAERLEHAISDKLLDRIDAYLGHPTTDPHGDPIPDADGTLRATSPTRLADCPEGTTCTITRVSDQDQSFLRFADRHGLRPPQRVTIEHRDRAADSFVVRTERGKRITMGGAAASKLVVETSKGRKVEKSKPEGA